MPTILLIEDDPEIRREVAETLEFHGYSVRTAGDGRAGVQAVQTAPPDLVLLDLTMPGPDGIAVLQRIRADHPALPVIIVTARDQEQDKLLGFAAGADDYVSKPFSLKELTARIGAVLRRGPAMPPASAVVVIGDAEVDLERYTVRHAGRVTELSHKECRVLALLVQHRGKVVSRETLLDSIWGTEYDPTPRTVDNFILRLRQKIEPTPQEPRYLLTVHGVGYKLAGEP